MRDGVAAIGRVDPTTCVNVNIATFDFDDADTVMRAYQQDVRLKVLLVLSHAKAWVEIPRVVEGLK